MFTDKFYSKVYFSTIEKAKQRGWKKARGRERHHIIPQSLGGSNDKSNLVYLSCREHFLCHWLLVKMTAGDNYHKMRYALMGMRAENEHQERYHTDLTARIYEKYRIEHAEYHSKLMKSKNLIPWNKGGVEITDKHREEIINHMGQIYITDKKYRLMACIHEKAEPWNSEGVYPIWHIALENTDEKMNYGIFVNGGLLVETCSLNILKNHSNLAIE
jgi:hypothetical protein